MSQTNKEHEVVILEEGIEIQHTKAYGIGIDTHSKFIQVSVLVKRQEKFFEYRREFPSDYDSLVAAKEWVCKVVETCSDPVVSLNGTLHFCIESTASYHCLCECSHRQWYANTGVMRTFLREPL